MKRVVSLFGATAIAIAAVVGLRSPTGPQELAVGVVPALPAATQAGSVAARVAAAEFGQQALSAVSRAATAGDQLASVSAISPMLATSIAQAEQAREADRLRRAAEDAPGIDAIDRGDAHLPVRSGAFMPPAAGQVDQVVSLPAGMTVAQLEQKLNAVGGEVLREYATFAMVAVRLPGEAAADFLTDNGIERAVEDDLVEMAWSGGQAGGGSATLAAANVPSGANASSQIGIAVIDGGVFEHRDVNVERHANFIQPSTRKQGSRSESGLQALYIFDEGQGARVFDRADHGGQPAHLEYVSLLNDAEYNNLVSHYYPGGVHPDQVALKSLHSVGGGSARYMDLLNYSNKALKVLWVNFEGEPEERMTVAPYGYRDWQTFDGHPWIIADALTGEYLSVIESPAASPYNDFHGKPITWHGEGASVANGSLRAQFTGTSRITAECRKKDFMALEAWLTLPPASTVHGAVTVLRHGVGSNNSFELEDLGHSGMRFRIKTTKGDLVANWMPPHRNGVPQHIVA
ncbi:MAG: hypothetical protein AAF184_21550, partial [Pseudomonadota bacterium]